MNLSRNLSRRTVIVMITIAGLSLWVPRQMKLSKARAAIVETRNQLNALTEQVTRAQVALEAVQAQAKIKLIEQHRMVTELAKAEKEVQKSDPASRWVNPPVESPEWNPESPYVWLRKEMMAQLPVSPFAENGELQPEIAFVMTVDSATQQSLNRELNRILTEYRELEAARVERTDEHLPGVAGQEGDKMTVRVQPLPEEGARLKSQFETALVEALGDQRTRLLLQSGNHWIDSNFAQFGSEPKTISVLRKSNGTCNVSIKSGGSWINTGGPAADVVRYHIPPNLRPIFEEFFATGTKSRVGGPQP